MEESLIIIYEGTLAITTELDAGQEVVLEIIKKGTVMNAHNFLCGRSPTANTKCLTSVTYYFLPFYTLEAISQNRGYEKLRASLNIEQ